MHVRHKHMTTFVMHSYSVGLACKLYDNKVKITTNIILNFGKLKFFWNFTFGNTVMSRSVANVIIIIELSRAYEYTNYKYYVIHLAAYSM